MLDPINFVQAYHATREVHRDYVRDLEGKAEEGAPEAAKHSVRQSRPLAWLVSLLASIPGERRLATALRHHA